MAAISDSGIFVSIFSVENMNMLMLVKSLHLCFIAFVCYMLPYPKSKELTSSKWRKYSSR